MTRRASNLYLEPEPRRCLTEFSIPMLVVGALALSALLWLAIYVVL